MTTTIKLALGAVLALPASLPAQAANATATASGTVIAPITISSAANLVFGSFAPGPVAGTVTVSTSNARSASGVILTAAGSPSAARFDITGEANTNFSVSLGGTALLVNGPNTMSLSRISDLTGANSTSGNVSSGMLDGAGLKTLYVGGTLSVAAGQAPGVYTGNVIATVEYN